VIDLHSHILPGLDDGARTLDDSVALALEAVSYRVQAMAATPHVRGDYPTAPETMEQGVATVRRRLGELGIDLQVLPGGELDVDCSARWRRRPWRDSPSPAAAATSSSSSRTVGGPSPSRARSRGCGGSR
jgi:hypothetical protein